MRACVPVCLCACVLVGEAAQVHPRVRWRLGAASAELERGGAKAGGGNTLVL